MTKNELITAITAKVEGMTKKDAGIVLDAIGEVIVESLKTGESVKIPGVGTFSTKIVPSKTGIYQFGDKKGETYTTEEHSKPVFKALPSFKEAVR